MRHSASKVEFEGGTKSRIPLSVQQLQVHSMNSPGIFIFRHLLKPQEESDRAVDNQDV